MADAVDRLIDANEAAICGPVVLEIRRGLRSRAERAWVLPLLAGCHLRRGATVKSVDLLIAAYALAHGVPLLTRHAAFERMKRAGARLLLEG